MRCPVCKGPMKPLFNGLYCPNDCDRKQPPQSSADAEPHQETDDSVTFVSTGGGWQKISRSAAQAAYSNKKSVRSIHADPDGSIWVTDGAGNRIKITSNGCLNVGEADGGETK